jgi:YggT family protein
VVQVLLAAGVGLLWLLVLGRVAASWVDPAARSPASRLLIRATEPMLGPVRRRLPATGMFDLSSLVVLMVLGAAWRALL